MKGVVAMEYPPSIRDDFVEDENYFWDEIPPDEEDGLPRSRDLIHFDIDPSNSESSLSWLILMCSSHLVFVGGDELDAQHTLIPLVKVRTLPYQIDNC